MRRYRDNAATRVYTLPGLTLQFNDCTAAGNIAINFTRARLVRVPAPVVSRRSLVQGLRGLAS